MQQAIAILDSGVGGLTVVKEVMRQLPLEKIVYFGDSLRAPYGPRPAEEVRTFTLQIVEHLLQYRPKMIVIACNTATAVAIDEIRSLVDIPVIGVIHPGARAAIKTTRNGIVGVIGTEGTILSRAYEKALNSISPHLEIISLACPRFVPLVEQGLIEQEETFQIVSQSLKQLKHSSIDCLILGCTHYPFLSSIIADVMGPDVALISSADETAREISTILYHKGLLENTVHKPIHQFLCSGDPELFRRIAEQWLNEEIKVNLVVWQVTRIG
ncbi:MAG: glutamate racemase [Paenibacillaceae bacterium]